VDRHKINNSIRFFSDFEDAIYPKTVNGFEDLNDEVFFELVKKISVNTTDVKAEVGGRVVVFFQWLMTIIPSELRKSNFPLVNSTLLTYIYVIKHIVNGSRVVKYSPYEEPKYYDKMLLIPSSDDIHLQGDSYRVFPLDVSDISNAILKKWYIDFFWKSTSVILSGRAQTFSSIFRFLLKLDKNLSNDESEISITEADIAEYITLYKSSNVSDSKISFRLQQLKKFLQFIETEYNYPVKQIFYRMMVFRNGKSRPNKDAYSKEEIKMIIAHLRISKPLIACAILIISNSELRTASVMNLKTDCLVKTVSKKGLEEYSVKVHTKTSENEVELININKYVKSYIEEALKLTEDIRKSATSYEKDFIFIFQPEGRTMPRRYKSGAFAIAINLACRKLDIKDKGTKGLRNNYMQAASNYLTKNNLSVALTRSITGHSINVHHSSYDQVNISEFFEQYYNLSIGNVYLIGTIKSNTALSEKAVVVGNCGFCSEEHCQLDGKLDCFMCKSFVTTLSCIPFYEKEIDKIERQIMQQTISHEKDFLLSKKKLLVGYLVKLYELREVTTIGNK
jgi:integrase